MFRSERWSARPVVSTAPANILPKLVEGTDVLEQFRPLRFRPMIFVNLRFRGRGLLPEVVTWFPDRSRPFFRLTEAPLAMPWLAPDGRTLITAESVRRSVVSTGRWMTTRWVTLHWKP